jgi:hypothetical protein
MAKRHLNSTTHWNVSGQKHSAHSRNLGNAIHWALKDAAGGHGSPEVGKAGPYTLEADVADGKVKGIFLKLRGNRYKVELDRQAMTGHDPGGHILDSIKRAMRSIAGKDDES